MSKVKKYTKLVVFDTLAVICFIGVALFGWLPGPGGIPLLILGLSLLAVNHTWAQRWLETAKHKGVTFKKWLFPNKPWVRNLYDAGTIALMILGGWAAYYFDHRILKSLGVAAMVFALFVFLVNRDRFDRLTVYFKRRK
jgi:uncharacterized membrane protein YfcA